MGKAKVSQKALARRQAHFDRRHRFGRALGEPLPKSSKTAAPHRGAGVRDQLASALDRLTASEERAATTAVELQARLAHLHGANNVALQWVQQSSVLPATRIELDARAMEAYTDQLLLPFASGASNLPSALATASSTGRAKSKKKM